MWDRFDRQGGSCFTCEQTGFPVAEVGDVAVAGVLFPLFACQRCVSRLEQLHGTMSERDVRRRGAVTSADEFCPLTSGQL